MTVEYILQRLEEMFAGKPGCEAFSEEDDSSTVSSARKNAAELVANWKTAVIKMAEAHSMKVEDLIEQFSVKFDICADRLNINSAILGTCSQLVGAKKASALFVERKESPKEETSGSKVSGQRVTLPTGLKTGKPEMLN